MKRTLLVSAIVLAIALILTFIWMGFSIAGMKRPTPDEIKKPLVLVSVEPYAEMVNQLAGDSVDVISVIPAHVDPHNWEPTYKDMTKLQGAQVWFTIGEGFESKLAKKLHEVNPKMVIVNLNEKVRTLAHPTPHDGHEDEFDTHTWLSPAIALTQARFMTTILADLVPLEDDKLKTNYLKLENELKELDANCAKSLLPYHGDILVVTHGAYTYYCEAFGLRQIVIEPSGGKEPLMGELSDLVSTLRQERERIVGIFIQPQHTNKAAKIMARDLDIQIFMLDPYAADYTETIRRLTMIITSSAAEGDPT